MQQIGVLLMFYNVNNLPPQRLRTSVLVRLVLILGRTKFGTPLRDVPIQDIVNTCYKFLSRYVLLVFYCTNFGLKTRTMSTPIRDAQTIQVIWLLGL